VCAPDDNSLNGTRGAFLFFIKGEFQMVFSGKDVKHNNVVEIRSTIHEIVEKGAKRARKKQKIRYFMAFLGGSVIAVSLYHNVSIAKENKILIAELEATALLESEALSRICGPQGAGGRV